MTRPCDPVGAGVNIPLTPVDTSPTLTYMEATTYQIARNWRTSLYEVHAAGCKHLMASHMETMGSTYSAATGAAVKDQFEDSNDGCTATLGPCAR